MIERRQRFNLLPFGLLLLATSAAAQWSARAAVPASTSQAVVVSDAVGRVHVISGFAGSVVVNTHHVYDPGTNTWSTLAPLPFTTRGAAGALGPDGKIYVAGGYVSGYVNAVAAYDVSANTWATLAPLPTAVWEARGAFGADGRFYVAGGEPSYTALQIYNPATNTWSAGAPLPTGRHQHMFLRGSDDRLYLMGGHPTSANAVSIYNPSTNTWTAGPAMPGANASMGGATSPTRGTLVLTGGGTSGGNNSGPFFNVTYAFNVATQTWSTLAPLPTARRELGAAAVGCTLYAIGGSNGAPLTTNEAGTNLLCASAGSSTSLTSTTNPTVFGQAATFQATVTGSAPTGTVTFRDGATILGTATLNAAGQASFVTSALTVGSHPITAVYGGDVANAGSTSAVVNHTVQQANTTTSLMASSNPSTVGGAVTFSATVTATGPGAGTPTGTVTFMNGTTTLGSAMLSAGTASFVTSALSVGTHTITAVFGGSTSFATSTSAPLSQAVVRDGATVALTSSNNPSTYTASVTFTATVTSSGPGGTPTGTVTFREGPTPLGTSTLNASGVALFTTSALTGGAHVITADYGGGPNHDPGTGNLTQTVDPAVPTVTLSSMTNPSLVGEPVTFSATVTGPGVPPTGTVTFRDGSATLGTSTLNGAGQTTLSTAALRAGLHTITAVFAGDTNYATRTSAGLTQDVQPASTRTAVASSSNPAIVGEPITFTATVTAVAPGAGAPSGNVTFREGTTVLGSAALDASGVASFAFSSLPVGSHSVTATFEGSPDYLSSVSTALAQVVGQDGVTVLLSASSNPSVYGAAVLFTATVSSVGPGGTPSGTVEFSDGSTQLGSGALDASGVATFSTSALAGGTHSITAVYLGDVNHTGGSSASLSQVVAPAATSVAAAASQSPTVYGQSVSFTATVTSAAGVPTGMVRFSDGPIDVGLVALDASGVATVSTSTLAAGDHNISASYLGNGNFAPTAALAFTQTVTPANTVTTLVASNNPTPVGAAVLFTATVAAQAPSTGLPTGMLTFKDGSTVLGSGVLNASGQAALSTSALSVGRHPITVEYPGDGNLNPSVSAVLDVEVSAFTAQMALITLPVTSTYGGAFSLQVQLSGTTVPTGEVSFRRGGVLLGTRMLDANGEAAVTVESLNAGSHTFTADYVGDATFGPASATHMHVVARAPTSLQLSSSGSPSATGGQVTFTATVSSAVPGWTGEVEFFDGATSLGTATLSGPSGEFTTSSLAAGEHLISATYRGDGNFAPSTSSMLTQTVTGGAAMKGGCGCQSLDGAPLGLVALLALGMLSTRRRRSCA